MQGIWPLHVQVYSCNNSPLFGIVKLMTFSLLTLCILYVAPPLAPPLMVTWLHVVLRQRTQTRTSSLVPAPCRNWTSGAVKMCGDISVWQPQGVCTSLQTRSLGIALPGERTENRPEGTHYCATCTMESFMQIHVLMDVQFCTTYWPHLHVHVQIEKFCGCKEFINFGHINFMNICTCLYIIQSTQKVATTL